MNPTGLRLLRPLSGAAFLLLGACSTAEIMQMQVIANRRNRGIDRLGIACGIDNPNINYAMMAKSMGMYAEGPIENPKDLGPALKRAIAVVKKGEPALIDVVSQGR